MRDKQGSSGSGFSGAAGARKAGSQCPRSVADQQRRIAEKAAEAVDVWEDSYKPYDDRVYSDGAFKTTMDELAKLLGEKQP